MAAAPPPASSAELARPAAGPLGGVKGVVFLEMGAEVWRRLKEKVLSWQEEMEDDRAALRRRLREANRFFLEAAGASASTAREAWTCPSPSFGIWAFPRPAPALLQRCTLSLCEGWAAATDAVDGGRLQEKLADISLVTASPVMVVLTIMGIVYFSYVGVFVPTAGLRLGSWSSLAFHSAFFLGMASFYQGIVVDPGGIPESWAGDPERLPNFALEQPGVPFEPWERKKKTGQLRYCNKEMKFKPDRAHFCSAEKRNVLRMDHYCPWLSNCVGFGNHKFFYLFLFYTMVIVGMGDVGFARALYGKYASAAHTFSMAQGLVLTGTLTSILLPFFAFHTWMLAKNMTTIEFCSLRLEAGAFHSPFDVGLWQNLQSVLGTEWYMWPLPVGAPPGDGLVWKVNQQAMRERHRTHSLTPLGGGAGAGVRLEPEEAEVDQPAAAAAAAAAAGGAGVSDAAAPQRRHLGGVDSDAEDTDGDTYKCFLDKGSAAVTALQQDGATLKGLQQGGRPAAVREEGAAEDAAAVEGLQQGARPAAVREEGAAEDPAASQDPHTPTAAAGLEDVTRQLHAVMDRLQLEDPHTPTAAAGLEDVTRQLHAVMDRLQLEDFTEGMMSLAEGMQGSVAAAGKDLAEKLRPATESVREAWTSTSPWRLQLLSATRDAGLRWLSPAQPAAEPAPARITTTVHVAARNAEPAAQ